MKRSGIYIAAFLLLGASSCKKSFFDINQNPNNVTEDQITAELIVPSAMNSAARTVGMFTTLSKWMGYWATSPTFALNLDEVTYNVTTSFGMFGTVWTNYYDALFDLDNVEKKSLAEGLDYYAGVAKVMKARYYQDLVDIWGNVPYTEAFNRQINTPKYDKGVDIYADLQKQLDAAIEIFKTKPVPSSSATVDVMFKGNATMWVKLANTIKLKLLINQSELSGFNPATETAKITANGGVLLAGQSANINPGYLNSLNQQNPYYSVFGYTVAGAEATASLRANNYILNIYKTTNDPRIARTFRPADIPLSPSNPYTGTDYGANPDASVKAQNFSYVGAGLSGSASQPQWVVTSVESMFLYAEAIARGWLPGDAQTAYENAVRESFVWLGVPNATTEANTYLANAAIANWANAGTTAAQRARFIGYQKYIALNGINPIEAWNLYRRLGVLASNPPLSVNPTRSGGGNLPARFLYPSTEYAVNAANVGGEGTVNLFTSKVFWDN